MNDTDAKELLKTLKSIEWFLGSIDSMLTMQLRISAQSAGISVEWKDKSLAPKAAFAGQHGETVPPVTKIKIGMPRDARSRPYDPFDPQNGYGV